MKNLLVIVFLLLSGCAFAPPVDAPLTVYNFGLQHPSNTKNIPTQSPTKSPILLIADATAPTWLDSQAIQYQLVYHNPMQLYTYANSRWAATPAAMMTLQVRNRILTETGIIVIKPGDGAQADYTLQIELNEFSQVFDAIDKSHATISLNASLIHRKTRALIAQHHFSMQQKAATADAAGGTKALTEASNKLTARLVSWIFNELADKNQ
ncbi:MAG: membrane integrity-associated transporter subunit PqiC [Nitrosomonas sp.]|nr:membrane integrity-associated transporter subunit PqiC [Nitrosomonas sp.]